MTQRSEKATGLLRLAAALESISVAVGRSVALLTAVMVVVTAIVVLLRYLFGLGWIWLQESITWMHAAVFMLAAAYTLAREEHVRVDVFYREMSARARAWVDLVGTLVLLLPVCIFLLWSGWGYVASSWGISEASQEAGGLPALYLLKSVLVAMPALLGLQGVALAARSAAILLRQEPAP